ncbi:MAG: hypothetical protein M3083_13700 [Actinomycetota bacterium]|nr:hypothetical protein [Actinomycetota bacterium]
MTDLTVQRIVGRSELSVDLAHALVDRLHSAVRYLDGLDSPLPHQGRVTTAFHR